MAKEHDGRFGKFYSAWAYDENEDAMRDANMNVYEAMIEDVVRLNENLRITEFENDEQVLSYINITGGYGHYQSIVTSKPEWMTMDEAALLIDGGNLCFGFQTMGNVVKIYTD